MRVLFDTSAIVKRYKREPGRSEVERLLGADAERDEHDIAPAWIDGTPRV